MDLIDEKYKRLVPSIGLLSDEVIVAQAWKKTHAYMRRHNWYADTLALDISALGLESNAASWAKQISHAKPLELTPMELVPAAKSETWIVDEKKGWMPRPSSKSSPDSRITKPPIRPLAHLTVRDQTLASAVMLCVADSIETHQGDCAEGSKADFHRARQAGVFSYGNRLLCDWKGSQARFRWGNAETYRRFFTDYQNFLKRPVIVGRQIAGLRESSEKIYIANLDISKFFDRIDRVQLIDRLRTLCTKGHPGEDIFWERVEQIFNWQWAPEAAVVAKKIGIQLDDGLPQGLVSAGFFANAYLQNFDNSIGKSLGESRRTNNTFVVHDYCRYVDDLRLVLSVDQSVDLE